MTESSNDILDVTLLLAQALNDVGRALICRRQSGQLDGRGAKGNQQH